MYINKRDRFNAIKKVTIQFGKMLNCENESDAEITMREPTEMEVLVWRDAQNEGTTQSMAKFREILADLIVSHNLMEDEKEKMTNEAVVELIYAKTEIVAKVVTEWSDKVFRTPQNRTDEK